MASTMYQNDTKTYGTGSIDYQKEWIIDSACSHHSTRDATLLSDVRPHDGSRVILTADNTVRLFYKIGSIY